jgi:hypothetical protein
MSDGVMAFLDAVFAVTLLVIDKRGFRAIAKIVPA